MKKRINDERGFTLIELLAVIVILAILMTLAVTSMTGIMNDAKKNTYVTTGQQFANAVRLGITNGDYEMPGAGECVAIATVDIDLSQGSQKSPFGPSYEADKSYVIVHNEGSDTEDKLRYYIAMVDTGSNGFALTEESTLSKKDVKIRGSEVKGSIVVPSVGSTLTLSSDRSCTVTAVHGFSGS